ncbi:putative cell surface protein [Sorangium cellulosum So ce56]|uniref:Cell surface protein n=1 Tax=Sorangium cellulosum (strain So ce56) TaxID=448385 RepID=A9GAP1_SORC5|nr:putative cell surface protein [Sorangium cellulosum So ce56]
MVSSRARSTRWPLVAVCSWVFVAALVTMGCGDPVDAKRCAPGEVASEDGQCEPKPCGPDEITLPTGKCQPAGLPPDMPCPPGQLALEDGRCQPAGVPPEACGEGFVADGRGGCSAILPEDECPEGQMAIPGETSCRNVASCGEGPWGDIPVEANTQFVDQSYAGDDSDGTKDKPWTTIQRAISKADSGAIVAVAEGTYEEDVLISGKAVRLWGRCPGLVEIRGVGKETAAVRVLRTKASGTEIRSLAVTGPSMGIRIAGAHDISVGQVWVHHTQDFGIAIAYADGPASVALKASLIEENHRVGVSVFSSEAMIEGTVIRSTKSKINETTGLGIYIADGDLTGESRERIERASVSIRASIIEWNHEYGILINGSDAKIETTVIRDTQPNEDKSGGYGIGIVDAYNTTDTGQRASANTRASVIERNHNIGVYVHGSDTEIEATVVRSTQASTAEEGGRGIVIQDDLNTGERARATIRGCLVDDNRMVGTSINGSDATLETTIIRRTQPGPDGWGGRGVTVQVNLETHERASMIMHACIIEENQTVGVSVDGADATIEATIVRATRPGADRNFGRGVNIQNVFDLDERSNLAVRTSLIEENHEFGVYIGGSDATIETSVIRRTQPLEDGMRGRGINAQDSSVLGERANLLVRSCIIEQNHDTGVAVFGSDATIETTMVRSTQPRGDGTRGRGIVVQDETDFGKRTNANIDTCVIEQNHEIGIFVGNSDVTIDTTLVQTTKARHDEKFGDGVVILGASTATIQSSTITDNDRAGVANFGSKVQILDTILTCNGFDLNGETLLESRPDFHGSDGWQCTPDDAKDCTETDDHCKVVSGNLEPPPEAEPLPPLSQP